MTLHDATVRAIGRRRLDMWIPSTLGVGMSLVQQRIAQASSRPRSIVVVRSCNSSGKTWLLPAIALGFYECYPDAKVITTSGSNETQHKHTFWGELRRHHARARIPVRGHLAPSAMELRDPANPVHYIVGQVPTDEESLRGYHGPHVLVVVDEGTAVDDAFGPALRSLMASGDARMVIGFNPTSEGTWAHGMDLAANTVSLPIRAWDTPLLSHFTPEQIEDRWGAVVEDHKPVVQAVPPGADFITPEFLDSLVAEGHGPGSLEWNTKVEARYWAAGANTLVSPALYDMAVEREGLAGQASLGVDLGLWGDSESVVVIRKGNRVAEIVTRSGMLPERFWIDVVAGIVRDVNPTTVVFDADGAGAGTIQLAKRICGSRILPFRGSHPLSSVWLNVRAMAWWRLKERFEYGDIALPRDSTLRAQVLAPTYSPAGKGLLKVESKADLRKRGVRHLDRADATVYSYFHDAPVRREELLAAAGQEQPSGDPYQEYGRRLRQGRKRGKPAPVRTAGSGLAVRRRR